MRQVIIILFFVTSFYIACYADQINVPGDYVTIQAAIDAASDGDTVLIAPGTYAGQGNREIVLYGRDILITGGGPEVTTLDADGSGAIFRLDFSGEDSNTIIANLTLSNASTGIYLSGASPRLVDLIVTGCSTGVGSLPSEGGGIFPIIERTSFTANLTGLALSNGSRARIDSCVFDSNSTAIAIDFASGAIFRSVFTANQIGISANYNLFLDTSLVAYSTFDNNGTSLSGSVRINNTSIRGGSNGIVLPIFSQAAVVENCLFENISGFVFQTGEGPAAALALLDDENPGFTVRRTTIQNCGVVARIRAPYEDVGQFLSLSECIVTGNSGGIDISGDEVTLILNKTLYAGNGGPIHFQTELYGFLIIEQSTIAGNDSDGINIGFTPRPITIRNNIIAFNGGAGLRTETDPVSDTISYSDFYSNSAGNYIGLADQTGINGNISADPLFIGGIPFDYHLLEGSPAIDSGDPAGELDPDGTRADMGAFNFSIGTPPMPFPVYAPISGTRQVGYFTVFVWGNTFDPDPQASFTYRLEYSTDSLFAGEVRAFHNLYDTALAVVTDTLASLGHRVFWRVLAVDDDSLVRIGGVLEQARLLVIMPPGDANGNGITNAIDVIYLVNYFKGYGSTPDPILLGDANADCRTNGLDVIYLVNYFKGLGPAPRRGVCNPEQPSTDNPLFR